MILGFFPLSIICDERRHPRRGAPRRVNKRGHLKNTGNCPAVPREGPRGWKPSYLRFSWFRCELTMFMPVSPEQKKIFFRSPSCGVVCHCRKGTGHNSISGLLTGVLIEQSRPYAICRPILIVSVFGQSAVPSQFDYPSPGNDNEGCRAFRSDK